MRAFTSLQDSSRRNRWAIIACASLLIIFAAVAYSAALTKSAIFDEALHLVGGYVKRTAADYRVNPEDPALFGFFASILERKGDLRADYSWPRWPQMLTDFNAHQWAFCTRTLFQNPGVDGDRIIQQTRFLFVLIGVALGAAIAWWSWRLAGAGAALIATTLYAFDPSFMAHSAVIKNDVPITLLMLLTMIWVWKFGQRGTWYWLAAIALTCAVAINVKFSGLLFGPIIFLTLLARALLPVPWPMAKWILRNWWQRLIVVPVVCGAVGLISYVAIWGIYRFRFSPTPDPDARLYTTTIALNAKDAYLLTKHIDSRTFSDEKVLSQKVPMVDAILCAEAHRLFPQAWLDGLLHTYYTTLKRTGYLLGVGSNFGWWYYFPCVILFKSPMATLLAYFAAIVVGILFFVRWCRPVPSAERFALPAPRPDGWNVICVALPMLVYGANAMSTNMNAGIRHILPLYPFIFVSVAAALSAMILRWKLAGGIVVTVLGMGLVIETLTAYPNYIAFFNAPSAAPRDGMPGSYYLLGDSNLDWGQDLKLLAQWQKQHQFKTLYLNYFGTADPKFYGVNARHLPGGWPFRTSTDTPGESEDCYVAMSVTAVQSFYYLGSELYEEYEPIRRTFSPQTVLGGSIYIYDFPLEKNARRQQ